MKTFASSFILLLLAISLPLCANAQRPEKTDSVRTEKDKAARTPVRGVQYSSRAEAAAAIEAQNAIPLFAGVSVSVDLCGALMAVLTPYGQYEAAARVNLRGRFFPIAEVGWGVSDNTNESTENHFKVSAPYWRVGMDYNVARDRRSGNRIYAGLRYGFSSYKYDMSGPDIVDGYYGTATPFSLTGLSGTTHWAEVVFGLEAKVWGMLHLGWSVRYRQRLHDSPSSYGSAWYVPGFGRNGGHCIGGTFNLIFDI